MILASALVAISYAADCRGIYTTINVQEPVFPIDVCTGVSGVSMQQYKCNDTSGEGYMEVYLLASDCSGAGTPATLPAIYTGECDTTLDDCESVTITGYLADDQTTCSDDGDSSAVEFSAAYINECYSYTSGGESWSRQYSCDSGCLLTRTWSTSGCSGDATTETAMDSGNNLCASCDDSGLTCQDYDDGASHWMTYTVFALPAAL